VCLLLKNKTAVPGLVTAVMNDVAFNHYLA
jgi:hypothetical protein